MRKPAMLGNNLFYLLGQFNATTWIIVVIKYHSLTAQNLAGLNLVYSKQEKAIQRVVFSPRVTNQTNLTYSVDPLSGFQPQDDLQLRPPSSLDSGVHYRSQTTHPYYLPFCDELLSPLLLRLGAKSGQVSATTLPRQLKDFLSNGWQGYVSAKGDSSDYIIFCPSYQCDLAWKI